MKERENIDKYLDLARELKKMWNMKVMVILIVADAIINKYMVAKKEQNTELQIKQED